MDQPISTRDLPSSHIKLPVDLAQRLHKAVCNDQKDEFVRLIKDPGFEQEFDEFTAEIFNHDALNIAIAVFNGETKGIIDPEDILDDGMTPLQLAASLGSPRLTKYLLERGDDVNVLCDHQLYNLKQATPLDLALESITYYGDSKAWTPRRSIFELLVHVSQRPGLEVVRLLVRNMSKERVRQAFLDYADKGQLVQLTGLFLAAPEVFLSSYFVSLRSDLSPFGMIDLALKSLEKRTEIEEGLSLLLDVFAMVGDKLVAYIRIQDPSIFEFEHDLKIAFLLREVALKKLGISSRADCYLLRFFKPVRPEADQLSDSYPRYMPEWRKHNELDGVPILAFYMKRKDITIDYVNRRIPALKPEDAALLNSAIENVLSSMPALPGLFEATTIKTMKRDKHPHHWFPFLSGRIFELSVPSFATSSTSAKSWFDFKFTPTNNLLNKVMKPAKLKPVFSALMLSYLPRVAKRIIK